MTKFQFTSDLLNIINALLQAGVTGCNIHETRGYLDELFDSFEEHEGLETNETINRGDLEMYAYLIDSLHQEGYELWLSDKEPEKKHLSEAEFIRELHKITGIPYDLEAYMSLPVGELEQEEEQDDTDHLEPLFPNLKSDLDALSIFLKRES